MRKSHQTATDSLKREFRRLFRSMDFLAAHPSLKRRGREGERITELYQQMGMLWEFLALQCPHRAGWRKAREGKMACKCCGSLRDANERWVLLPAKERKMIGRKRLPNSDKTFPNKKAATVVHDDLEFHGAKVEVDVHNSYRSKLFRRMNINVAAERIVRLEEDGVECSFSGSQVRLRLKKHKMGERPPYGAFVFELPKRALKKFPLLVEFDTRGELVGVDIFRPLSTRTKTARKPTGKRSPSR